jgi:hypothetical protein
MTQNDANSAGNKQAREPTPPPPPPPPPPTPVPASTAATNGSVATNGDNSQNNEAQTSPGDHASFALERYIQNPDDPKCNVTMNGNNY